MIDIKNLDFTCAFCRNCNLLCDPKITLSRFGDGVCPGIILHHVLLYYRITLLYCISVLYYFVFLVRWRVLLYNNPLSYLYPSPLLSEALEFVYLSVAIGFEISTFSVHFLWRFALSKSVPSSVRDNDRKFPHFCRLFRHALLCALINGRQLFVNVLMCSIRCFIPSSCQQLSSLCHAITLVSAH